MSDDISEQLRILRERARVVASIEEAQARLDEAPRPGYGLDGLNEVAQEHRRKLDEQRQRLLEDALDRADDVALAAQRRIAEAQGALLTEQAAATRRAAVACAEMSASLSVNKSRYRRLNDRARAQVAAIRKMAKGLR